MALPGVAAMSSERTALQTMLGMRPGTSAGPLLPAWFRVQYFCLEQVRALAATDPQELYRVAAGMRDIGQRCRAIDRRREQVVRELDASAQTVPDLARALISTRGIRAEFAALRSQIWVLRRRAEAAVSVAVLRETLLADFHRHDDLLRGMLEVVDGAIAVLVDEGITEDLAAPRPARRSRREGHGDRGG